MEPDSRQNTTPVPYPRCYGCGTDNPRGLKLDFEFDGSELRVTFTPADDHQGYPGIVHGGVISALLYELMANLPRYLGDEAVLRSCTVEFRRPVPLAEPLEVSAAVVERTGRGWSLSAELIDRSGRRLASATGDAVSTGGRHG